MIYGIGIDILEIKRLERILKSKKKEFLKAVFTQKEINYSQKKAGVANLATAFAAKEAVLKSLNLPTLENIGMKEIEIIREKSGKPTVCLLGSLAKTFPPKHYQFFLSLSYTEEIAIANVVLEKD